MKMYRVVTWWENGHKTVLGVFPEDFCRRYCKEFAGKNNGFHVSCEEVAGDE